MAELPEYGKIGRDFFERVIYPNLGARNRGVVVGPAPGVDTCAVRTGKNRILAATTDPISLLPDLGPEDSAWLSVNLIASDLATSGFPPGYAIFDFNLPPQMKSSVFERYWKALSRECEALGIAIVGGHTGKFEGLNSTVIGAGTMFSLGREDSYLTSRGGRVGDKVLITKGAAIATTGILARSFPDTIEKRVGSRGLRLSKTYLKKITVVRDALTAIKVGVGRSGVSAMHDATEGGVLSALYELASASRKGMRIELKEIPVSDETKSICEIFEIDPLTSLGEGSLVFSCAPFKVEKAISLLHLSGLDAKVVGELTTRKDGIVEMDGEGRETPIKYPVIDPYWQAYYDAKKSGWN